MTEQEAKLFLYKFLMKNGIATRYYYNCIYFNDQGFDHVRKRFLELEPKRRLKAIMKSHMKYIVFVMTGWLVFHGEILLKAIGFGMNGGINGV